MLRPRVTLLISVGLLVGVLALAVALARRSATPAGSKPSPGAGVTQLDPGKGLSRPAPDFTLTDQFGQRVSLRSYRGRVVILAFNDSECTTVCPLTTTAMLDAKAMLGAAGSKVALLGVNANPEATSISRVRAYSRAHAMMHQWRFLTGSLAQLKRVWGSYGIAAQIIKGEVDHTPALFVISPSGRLKKLYLTTMLYASVPQQGRLLAQEASSLLPGHPQVSSEAADGQVTPITPTTATTLPAAGGGTSIGPGTARLQFFFATWDAQVIDLRGQLTSLSRYRQAAARQHLPPLTAVDEGSVEPSSHALPALLASLRRSLGYPVAIDQTGRVADGYQVQDQPWLVLTSSSGRILWYRDVSTDGLPRTSALMATVRAALRRAPAAPTTRRAVAAALAGSPAPLAALHAQANELLGSISALKARLRALKGYPVVLNIWQSGCLPCRAEFSLLASASARYGKRVAFLGADASDLHSDAQAFLARHPVSYPSYQSTVTELSSLAPISGLPTTLFFSRAGAIVWQKSGQYETQGTLDRDIEAYARP